MRQNETVAGVEERKAYARPVRMLRDEEGVPVRIVYTGRTRLVAYDHPNPLKHLWVNANIKLGIANPLGEDLTDIEKDGIEELEMRNEEIRRKREVM